MDQRLESRFTLLVEDPEDAIQLGAVEPAARQLGHQPHVTIGVEAVFHGEGPEVLAKQQTVEVFVVLAGRPDHEEIEGDSVPPQGHRDIDALAYPALDADQPRAGLAEGHDLGVFLGAQKGLELR
jgi:hypothetical protein